MKLLPLRAFVPRRHWVLFLTLCLGSTTARPLAAAPEAEPAANTDPNRPRVLYRQAEAAFAAGKVDEARRLLLEAWGIQQSYDVAAALGQAELELKLYRDAAEHLDFAVRHFAPLESETALEGIKGDLLSAKSQVAEVHITVSEPGATVSVNGQAIGTAPLPSNVFLEPGNHAFAARLAPDRHQDRRLALARGGTYELDLVLPAGTRAASDTGTPAAPNYTAPIITAIAGGLALGAGVTLLVLAGSKDRDRDDLVADLPEPNACQPGAPAIPECDEVSDLAHGARNLRVGAGISFGAAVGAGIATYLLWPQSKAHRDSAFRAVPVYSPESGTLVLSASGRF
jgi:hypothetical protein